MNSFPEPVIHYWEGIFTGDSMVERAGLSLAVNTRLSKKRPVMIMMFENGCSRVVVRPDVAEVLGSRYFGATSVADLQRDFAAAGIALHSADHLFYLPVDHALREQDCTAPARELTEADRALFDIFYNAASEQDREDAFVELDHWAVAGCIDQGRLVSAASMCLWADSPVADLGVLTLPHARGKGFARAVVRTINAMARQRGYEPQYRCQIDNHASVALAKSCGFAPYGRWIVADDAAPAMGA